MTRTSKLGEALEDRRERLSIRASVRRNDVRSMRRDASQSFPYESNHARSRIDAVGLAKARVTEQALNLPACSPSAWRMVSLVGLRNGARMQVEAALQKNIRVACLCLSRDRVLDPVRLQRLHMDCPAVAVRRDLKGFCVEAWTSIRLSA
jgi:hypothetical protein